MEMTLVAVLILIVASIVSVTFADDLDPPQCGWQKEGELCPNNLCCSSWGFCGSTDVYCNEGCQSQCTGGVVPPPPPAESGVEAHLSSSEFDEMLKNRDDPICPAHGFYTYKGFVAAARKFPEFATTGNSTTQKREIAAFLAQTSHQTAGLKKYGYYTFGYCDKIDSERDPRESVYCITNTKWRCVPGKSYYGRGPMFLKYNTNYGPAGEALGYDLLNNPDLLSTNETISFESALWFWMTPQSPKPSSHDVITGNWIPSPADVAAGRLPGYGVITNIINGDGECGTGYEIDGEERIAYYKIYCDIVGGNWREDDTYDHFDCYDQIPFGRNSLIANTYIEYVMVST